MRGSAPTAGPGFSTRAPAKVNLTLHVLGRRPDGYHELESLVAFAGAADLLSLQPGPELSLTVEGPTAGAAGPPERNLVIRAAGALLARRPGLAAGAFHLVKRLPAAAGIGGGSSDAAAALRLLAEANGLAADDPDVVAAARATGADVPVCLDPRARMMRGAGEEVGPPLPLPPLFAVLVNPGVAVATAEVFRALGLSPGEAYAGAQRSPEGASHSASAPGPISSHEGGGGPREAWGRWSEPEPPTARPLHCPPGSPPSPAGEETRRHGRPRFLASLAQARNDLEEPSISLAPAIGEALARVRETEGCRLARMSGSGATVFGLYEDCHAASRAARAIGAAEPGWWVKATLLR